MSKGADLPDDVDALKAMLLEARASISQMQQDMAERDLEIEKLKAQIDKYKRMQFGSKSEKLGRVIEELETRLEDLSASRGAAEMLAARAQPQNSDKSSSTPRERARVGYGANRLGESVKVFSPIIWWSVMSKRKGLEALFDGRHFDREIIILCVRWYLRYKLSLRDLVEMMAERGLSLVHTTIMRWVKRFTPEFVKRWNRFGIPRGRSWRVDETYLKIRGKWVYLDRKS